MGDKVYLVGDTNSPKTNQWLSMTDCPDLAEARKAELGPTATTKVIEVSPARHRRGK